MKTELEKIHVFTVYKQGKDVGYFFNEDQTLNRFEIIGFLECIVDLLKEEAMNDISGADNEMS